MLKPERTTHTPKKKRSLLLLLIGIASFLLLVYLIFLFAPDAQFPFLIFSFSSVTLFFILLFIFLFSIGSFIFKSKIHGILIALLVIIYLVFRQNNLTHPFFAVLLLALYLVLELLFTYRK